MELVLGEGDVINGDGGAAGVGGMETDGGDDAFIVGTEHAHIEFVDTLGVVGRDREGDAFVKRGKIVPKAVCFGDEVNLGFGAGGGGHADDDVPKLVCIGPRERACGVRIGAGGRAVEGTA